ncbi:non-ribosomal peptide synthetase [uncultured Bilophila sp.]|uniref:non-ribosomal peptide synthetase n=1 Tax=uncultured Bilophila sp. TaxID=529385 RepID=UPI0026DBB93A|nr:non-ribosomal peptide synthetase [uncultured Bilophila sp.]
MLHDASLLPGGGSLSEEQESLLALFLEKDDFAIDRNVEKKPVITLRPEDRYKPFPLTDIQLAYMIGRDNASLGASNVSSHVYFEMDTVDLDFERYQNAWRKFVERHDMMRSVIFKTGQQMVLEHTPPFEVRYFDLRGETEERKQEILGEIREELRQKIKPVDVWPMYDIYLSRIDEHTYRMHVSLEGLNADVLSFQTMMVQVQNFYNNPDLELPPLELTFRDYVLSLTERRNMESYKQAQAYWRERIPTLAPGPRMPVLGENAVGAPVSKPMDGQLCPEKWKRLKDYGTKIGLSPTSILLAAFSEVLRRWNSEKDFCLNLTLFNRLPLHPQIDEVIGDFTDTLLLEVCDDPGATFEQRAIALRDRLWNDLDNRQFGGVDVLRELNRFRSANEQQYLPVVFTSTFLIGDYGDSLEGMLFDGHPVKKVFTSSQTPQLLLDHQVYESAGWLRIHWDVRAEYFYDGYLESMLGAYVDLLERLADDESLWNRKDVVLLPAEQIEKREAYNRTEGEVSSEYLHTLFARSARSAPEHMAVVAPGMSLTYAELAGRVATLAQELDGQVKPNELVAVVMEKGWEQAVAVLGVQYAGAAYLPLDPSMPRQRMEFILRDAGVRFVLTQFRLMRDFEWMEGMSLIAVDALSEGNGAGLWDRKPVQAQTDLAYVIYTSGSTGTPKGVMISHRAAVNTIVDINSRFHIGPEDRAIALANLGFDLSVWDIFGTLAAGGTIVFPDAAQIKEPGHWLDLVQSERVTVWNTVPAMMKMLVEYKGALQGTEKGTLRLALLSGDWLPLDLPDQIRAHYDAEVVSLGGATEASIWSILYPIGTVDPKWESIPYGYPMLNQRFYVLNDELRPCPDYVSGNLYIGGVGLSDGYWHDPENTEKSFIVHPVTGERLYRTGDMGYFHPEGYVVLLGREDNQLKINGFRVELGEIEHAMLQHPDIREAVVQPLGDKKNPRLAAYFTAKGNDGLHTRKPVEWRDADGLWKRVAAVDAGIAGISENTRLQGLEKNIGLGGELYEASVQASLYELGVYRREGESHTPDEILRITGIRPRYERWLKRALLSLEEAGFLARDGEAFRLVKPFAFTEAGEVQARFAGQGLGFLASEAKSMVDLLLERKHSAEVYASGKVKGLYGAVFHYSYQIIRDAVAIMAQDHPLDILEVGGGHGGATTAVMQALPENTSSFCFTDISRYFLQNAGEKFKDAPFFSCRLFDLDEEIVSQGFAPHAYDVIIAASVLHDVKRIAPSLARLRSLLKPGGVLFIIEQTLFFKAHDLTMGLQQGFDVFEDTDLRPLHPLLSGDQWEEQLKLAGFDGVHQCHTVDGAEQNVILARAPLEAWQFEPSLLEAFLRERVPGYMVPSVFVELDVMPRNRSGKIDRQALPLPEVEAGSGKPARAPETETQKRLADLWASILQIEAPGLDDSFFELGGDSLLATVLITRIHEAFKVELGVQELYTLNTLLEMAEYIDRPRHQNKILLPLQESGKDNVIIGIAEGRSRVELFADFARLYKDEADFYGCILRGKDGKEEPLRTVEDIAAYFVEEILRVRPKAKLTIVGFCVGGMIGYEMAVQLQRRGVEVKHLAAVDTGAPGAAFSHKLSLLFMYLGTYFLPMNIYSGLEDDPILHVLKQPDVVPDAIPLADLMAMSLDECVETIYRYVTAKKLLEDVTLEDFAHQYKLFEATVGSAKTYRPSPYKGTLKYFFATDLLQGIPDPRPFWRTMPASEVTIFDVPGNHFDCILGDNARNIADAIGSVK